MKNKYTWLEFSGGLGDLGLFIPLVVAMTVVCDLNIGVVLILAGLMNIVTGLLFKQPIPVQPMKALAAVVITEGLMREELFAAGIQLGLILICVSFFLPKIDKWIPISVIHGIQCGVGLKLALKGFEWIGVLDFMGWDSMVMALCITFLLLFLAPRIKPILVIIFILGFLLMYLKDAHVFSTLVIGFPEFRLHLPATQYWMKALTHGTLVQLPLTLLNSVIAVCALSESYFPKKGVTTKKMSFSVGLMNLICIPLGGIPMCHGAGGLAAQYRFGARSGGSVVMLGVMKVVLGFIFGAVLLNLLYSYPLSILAPMIILAGFELVKASRKSFKDKFSASVVIGMAVVILAINTLAGFCAGGMMVLLKAAVKKN